MLSLIHSLTNFCSKKKKTRRNSVISGTKYVKQWLRFQLFDYFLFQQFVCSDHFEMWGGKEIPTVSDSTLSLTTGYFKALELVVLYDGKFAFHHKMRCPCLFISHRSRVQCSSNSCFKKNVGVTKELQVIAPEYGCFRCWCWFTSSTSVRGKNRCKPYWSYYIFLLHGNEFPLYCFINWSHGSSRW